MFIFHLYSNSFMVKKETLKVLPPHSVSASCRFAIRSVMYQILSSIC